MKKAKAKKTANKSIKKSSNKKDIQNVITDIQTLSVHIQKLNADVFGIFHAMPFMAGIISITAADAAKIVNPLVDVNSLVSILTSVVVAARQGQSSLQIFGELQDEVKTELETRGFKIEAVEGSDNNKGLFILWT